MPDEATRLSAERLPELLGRVHRAFAAHRQEMDDLNVFPVPDGDTGTNLVFTARSALEALDGVGDGEVGPALVKGALMGARGNSGVIFSQVLRALAETWASDRAGGATEVLARGLARAEQLAYEAIADPVEGTMLTAIRAAADASREAAAAGTPLPRALARVLAAVQGAVRQSRNELAANRDAGVVDAGARGFEVFVSALRAHVAGTPLDELPVPPELDAAASPPCADAPSGFRFEVQYLLAADEARVGELRQRLEHLGDSVAVVAAEGLMNVHVHTDDIGAAIELGVEYGRPSRIEVTDFAEQVAASGRQRARRKAASTSPPARLGVVAVLPAGSLHDLARAPGVEVVAGAAGALPSVADLLNAAGEVEADEVVLLPGHPNVVPTAHQAAEISRSEGGRRLVVVDAAAGAAAVLAALSVHDPEAAPERELDAMGTAAAGCACGEVVAAVRDADTPIGPVGRGDLLAVAGGEVVAVGGEPVEALTAAARACGAEGAEVVTLILGAEVGAEERERAVRAVRELAGAGAEVEVLDGGQRPARYLLGVER